VRIADPERCLSAFPHEFSGGMRQRIMLASVMLLRPKLLIADEPTTALDTLAQREVLDLMVELARDSETAVLLITHNLGLVARYTQDVVVLRNGRIMEAGPTATVLAQPQSSYTRSLLDAVIRKPLSPQSRPKGPVLVRAEGLTVRYKGRLGLTGRRAGHAAVCDANLEIREGETVAVVGGSGSGKTTLGRALLGLLPATAGRIKYRGHDIVTADAETRRRARLDCQMVFQDPFSSLDPRQRIGDIVLEPLRHRPDLTAAERHRRAAEVLDEVGLGGLGRRYPHELSGGQRQRVAIARAVVRRPPFVVADEPISALDVTIQAQVLELFRSLQRRHGFACLFISHDLAAVQSIAHRVVVMEAGRIVEEGPIDAVFAMPRQPYTRALIEATPLLDGPRDPEGPRTVADPGACAG
jgi:peptide/nickel transport system ATP-binding protein